MKKVVCLEVADHSSSMLTGGDRLSERRQQVADNHSLSMLTGGDHSSEDRHQHKAGDKHSSSMFFVF